MKRIWMFALLSLALATAGFAGSNDSGITSNQKNEVTLRVVYGDFQGHPLELVLDSGGLSLCIREVWHKFTLNEQEALEFIKNEALRFANTKGPVELGDTNFSLQFKGGYLIWGPYSSMDGAWHSKCLMFSRDIEVKQDLIIARGSSSPNPWDGYTLWKPRR